MQHALVNRWTDTSDRHLLVLVTQEKCESLWHDAVLLTLPYAWNGTLSTLFCHSWGLSSPPQTASFTFQLGPPLPHLTVSYFPPPSFIAVIVMGCFERLDLLKFLMKFVVGWGIHLMQYLVICRERCHEFMWLGMGVSWTGDISKSRVGHKFLLSSQKTRTIK